jgi:hypothetical protein
MRQARPPRAPYRPRPLSIPALSVALLSLGHCAPALAADPEAAFWDASFKIIRRRAPEEARPILLLFPPIGKAELPRPLQEAALPRGVRQRFLSARVRADEVEDLQKAFRVGRVPALVLLDRHGGAVERWEGTIPADLWPQVDRAARRLKAAEEALARALSECRAALEREDFAAALAAVRDVRARARPGYPEPEAASRIEATVLARADLELKKTLGGEGILPDPQLSEELGRLRDRFPHPAFRERLDREAERLRSRSLGGTGKPSPAKAGR